MPCPGPLHFTNIADYVYDFCPLPVPDVSPSVLVCDVEHTSFHFGVLLLKSSLWLAYAAQPAAILRCIS